MDKELASQLKQVLTSLQLLLPKPVAEIDWAVCHAADSIKRLPYRFIIFSDDVSFETTAAGSRVSLPVAGLVSRC